MSITDMYHYSLNDVAKNNSRFVYLKSCSALSVDIFRSALLYFFVLYSILFLSFQVIKHSALITSF